MGIEIGSYIPYFGGDWDCHNRNPSLLPTDDSAPFMLVKFIKSTLSKQSNVRFVDLSYHISSEYTFFFSCLPQWARKYRKSSYSAVFFQKWDRDWIVDPIFRQGLRLTRVLKKGLRLDFRSHFKAGIENGL